MPPLASHHDTRGAAQLSSVQIAQFILKVASRCNLNCSYCYIYNKADSTWKSRPPLMSDEIFRMTLDRIRRHCVLNRQNHSNIVFHGGEPCLIGVKRFDSWCAEAKRVLHHIATVKFHIQTNATLLDEAWAEEFRTHDVSVGISMDGPKHIHDLFRVDHKGRGSYDDVVQGIKVLKEAQVPFGILAVIPLGANALSVHHQFLSLGCTWITYVLPHFTHDTIAGVRQLYGETPCADFLIPIFDDWWFNSTMDVQIGDLRNMAKVILGGNSEIETVGNLPPTYVFIEPDGEMEGLDNLRACADGITKINLNVKSADFTQILETDTFHRTAIFEGMPLPQGCRACPERDSCGGGYLPHRYSAARGFDNPSVWCADLLKLFTHLRLRLNVTIEDTNARRKSLQTRAARASGN